MMIQSDAVKALVSLAEDNNVLVSKAKAKKVLVRLREQDEDMSIDDAYLTLSNAFLADHTLFADHEQLSASGSVLDGQSPALTVTIGTQNSASASAKTVPASSMMHAPNGTPPTPPASWHRTTPTDSEGTNHDTHSESPRANGQSQERQWRNSRPGERTPCAKQKAPTLGEWATTQA